MSQYNQYGTNPYPQNTTPYGQPQYQDHRQSISQTWAENSAGGPLNVYRSDTGATHSYSHEERRSFVAYINDWLQNDPDLKGIIPINPESEDLFSVVASTPILCKLVNVISPGAIDERKIRKVVGTSKDAVFAQNENLSLGIQGCKNIGLVVANLGAGDIAGAKPHMILGLVWQIIKKGLLSQVSMDLHPELSIMLSEHETAYVMQNAPPEQNLLRWFNYHLRKTHYPKDVKNFRNDICDGQAYLALLESIAPDYVPKGVFQEPDLSTRVDWVCAYANQMGCGGVIAPEDIKSGNDKLNLAFTAYLFNKYPGLDTWEGRDENLERERELAALREQQEREFKAREEQLRLQYSLQEQELQQRLLKQQQEEKQRREEGEKQAKMFEEARLKHEAELESARQAEAEQRRQYEAMLRYQEQQRLAQEEAKRREEEDRRQEEERRRRYEEEERRKKEEEERAEAERRRLLEEEARRKAAAEEAERQRLQAEEEARRKAWDEYNQQQAMNAAAAAEEERRRAAWDEYYRQEALKQEQARLAAEEEERKRQQAWAEYNAQQEALKQQEAAAHAIAMANEAASKAAAAQQAAQQAAAVQQQLLQQQNLIAQQKAQQELLLAAQQAEALKLTQPPPRPKTTTTTITKTTIQRSVFPIKKLTIRVKRASRLIKKSTFSKPDPYVKSIYQGNYQKTMCIKTTCDPTFEYDFTYLNVDEVDVIVLQIYDDNQISKDEFLGEVKIIGADCGVNGAIRDYVIRSRDHRMDKVHGTLTVEFRF